jgi:hypothetical protein
MKRTLFILLALLAVAAWADDFTQNHYIESPYQHITSVSLVNNVMCVDYRILSPYSHSVGGTSTIGYEYRRDIYGVVDGKIALIKTVTGKVVPAQRERVEWPEDK